MPSLMRSNAPTASAWKMTEAEAKKRDPGAEAVPGTQEVRNLPESRDEWEMTSDFLRKDKG